MQEKRKVPLKNYFIAFLIVLGILIVTLYAKKTYELNNEKMLSQSVLSRVVGEIKYKEISSALVEKKANYFIYVSYVKSKDTYDLEVKLKKLIAAYELQDNFYYINITDELTDTNLITNLNIKFNLNLSNPNNIPFILYYQNGSLKSILKSSDDKLFNPKSLERILINNGYQKS